MNLEALLAERRVCICAGSGGVGKTTTAAAIAANLAARGRRVAVVTIDPARRLADSLGLEALGNEPHQVDPARFRAAGVEPRGELWALQLDPKRTFDDLIDRVAPTPEARDEVLANPIYAQISTAVAGSQEFTALAKLHELHRDGGFDLIVLDTPPSRNALDFLDAPDRLLGFFEGRALKAFLRPAGLASRVVGRGAAPMFAVLRRVTGVDLLRDLSVFFGALSGMIDAFRERASQVGALLGDPATTFVLVTSPEPAPIAEAAFFRRRLRDAGMPFGGVVANRVHPPLPDDGPELAAAEPQLVAALGADLAARVRAAAESHRELGARDREGLARLRRELGVAEAVEVPILDEDVHDLAGLLRLGPHLLGPVSA